MIHRRKSCRSRSPRSKFFRFVTQLGGDPVKALQGFYRNAPERLEALDLSTAGGVRELLSNLRGQATLARIAEQLGRDRFAVGRWFSGQTEPRLPEFLHLIDACTLRLPDFVAGFADPATLPELASLWSNLQAPRRAAYQLPWSHGRPGRCSQSWPTATGTSKPQSKSPSTQPAQPRPSTRTRACYNFDLIEAALSEAARKTFAMLPQNYEFQGPTFKKGKLEGRLEGRIEGKLEGQASAVITVLEARGLSISDEQKTRILGCSESETINGWLTKAVTVAHIDELFAE